ncbi:hypothetical protein SAMN05444157_1652 [Frankineae bacterium MT45]|nr:hypothetical protein SAMN05444157_1652 [Frankineae bacterium MT45]
MFDTAIIIVVSLSKRPGQLIHRPLQSSGTRRINGVA